MKESIDDIVDAVQQLEEGGTKQVVITWDGDLHTDQSFTRGLEDCFLRLPNTIFVAHKRSTSVEKMFYDVKNAF